MLAKPVLLIDVETTGLDPREDCIIELSACLLSRRNLDVERVYVSYVKPTTPISASSQQIHGLTDDDLKDAPTLQQVLTEFDAFAPSEVILAGHNVSFDAAFLREAYESLGMNFGFDYHLLDVWSIAFFLLGAQQIELPAYNLSSLCAYFGIRRSYHHDAKQDVLASASILRHLFERARGVRMDVLDQINLFEEDG